VPPNVLRSQLISFQAQEVSHRDKMAYKYLVLTATQKTPFLSVDQVCMLAADLNATLVEYYSLKKGWVLSLSLLMLGLCPLVAE
jgi:hypothetical protein